MPIYSNTRRVVWQTWLAAIVWNALTWTAIVKGYDRLLQIFEEQPVFLFFVLFPLLGVLIVFSAIRETLVLQKFGRTVLIPDGSGQGVAGYVLMPDTIGKASPARLSLACYRQYSYQSSEGSETKQKVIWQDENIIIPKLSGSGHRVDFRFHPPGDVPATGEQGQDKYHWELRLHMPLPGIDCNISFELPVAASMLGGSNTIEYAGDTDTTKNALESMPAVENVAGGLRFNYPAGRAKGSSIAFMFISIFIGCIVFLMCKNLQHFLVVTGWLILSGTLSMMMVLFLVGLYLAFNTLTVDVDANGVRKEMKIFGYRFTEQVAAADIVDIDVQTNGSASYGNRTRVYYALKLICRDRPVMEVGDSIENYGAAQQLRDRMLKALGENRQSNSADARLSADFPKLPLPNWLKKLSRLGRVLKYAFVIALIYDLAQWVGVIELWR